MNKNLKKVISAASALAVTASGIGVFAATYPDVPQTADYYQAVSELSALKIIEGYEDGTFQPEANVTRAQIAKMVVVALGDTVGNAAEAAAGKDTQFTDVPGTHWAAGYIAVATTATAQNFINGYSDTTFGPEDNVTYAQAIKMLVCALGYSQPAEDRGGWPSGYLAYGYSLGLTDGLSGIGNDEQLNRAQVAVLIDNALKSPVGVESTTVSGYVNGKAVYSIIPKDGTGDLDGTKDGYQNLLNYAHDAYLVYGRVTGTFATGDTDKDKVRFSVEKSDNWEGYSINAAKGESADSIEVYKGDVTDADDNLFTYSQAILQQDDNDEYTLISLTPQGSSEQVELETSDYKTIKTTSNGEYQLQMYKDENQSKYDTYKLDSDVDLYVNGKSVGFSDENIADYIEDNNVGKLTLVDESEEGKSSTDGKYDYIMVSYYLDGVVDEVSTTSSDVTKIYFDTSDPDISKGVIELDYSDDDKSYTILKDDVEIDVSEIQSGDVISVSYDVTGRFADSDSYTLIVSQTQVEGKLSSLYTGDTKTDNEYTFDDGNTYKIAYETAAGTSDMVSGSSYTLYLDAFGKIAKAEELASSKKYALVDNVYEASDGTDHARIITGDGTKSDYEIYDKNLTLTEDGISSTKTVYEWLAEKYAEANSTGDISGLVIEYSINAKGNLNVKDFPTAESFSGEYKTASSKLGAKKVSSSVTSILDVTDYELTSSTYSSVALDNLGTDTDYEGYAYGKTGDTYQFVLITSGIGGFNVNNNMAVYVQSSSIDTNDGNKTAAMFYVASDDTSSSRELQTVALENDDLMDDYSAGDTFFYKLDSNGYIEEVRPVVQLDGQTYQELYKSYLTAMSAGDEIVNSATFAQFNQTAASNKFNLGDAKDAELIAGLIVDYSGGDVKIASAKTISEAKGTQTVSSLTADNIEEYSVASDANVYTYDYSVSRAKDRVDPATTSSIRYNQFDRDSYIGDKDDNVINLEAEYSTIIAETNSNYGNAYFAVAQVVEDEITNILLIIPDDDADA